jgi:predicted permease
VLAEVALLNGLGAALGLGLARALLPLLLRVDPAATRALGPVSIDGRVIGYTAGSALLASALASVVPALVAVRGSLGATLGGATPRSGGSRARERWRSALLVIQSAVCLALLTTGGLLLQYVLRSSRVDPGFRAEGVLTAQLRLPALRYEAPEARVQLVAGLLERLSASPQVTAAATGLNDFVPGNRWVTLVRVPERPNPDGSATAVVVRRVSAGYFRTLEIPMLRGRDFDERDHADATLAVIVSRAFSVHFWPGEDPLGRTIERGGRTFTVIGEVEDAADVDLLLAPEPTVYVTWTQSNTVDSPIALMVRTRGDPEAFVPELRQIVGQADPMLPLDRIQPLATFLSDSLAPPRFRAVIVLGLALVGLALGALGVAALTAQSVGERTAELGVRVVLGAEQRSLWRSTVLRQLGQTGWGLALGLALSLGAARLLASLLPGIGGFDAKVALAAAAVLACTALAAAAVPASRVLHIDPARLLLR